MVSSVPFLICEVEEGRESNVEPLEERIRKWRQQSLYLSI